MPGKNKEYNISHSCFVPRDSKSSEANISEKKKGVDVFYTLCSYYYTLELNIFPSFWLRRFILSTSFFSTKAMSE